MGFVTLTAGMKRFWVHMSIHDREPIKVCTPSFGDDFEISDQNCDEPSKNFENLPEETAEMFQNRQI